MADVTTNGGTAVAEPPKTEAQLMVEMNAAVKSGDYKQVAKVAQELVKFQKAKEQAEHDAKVQALVAVEVLVKGLFGGVGAILTSGHPATADELKNLTTKLKAIQGTELDQADGIWYTNDFGEKLATCRLMKATKAAGKTGGGGAGKKFSVSTTELLEKFGSEPYKEGLTFQAAWDSNADKNWRYGIREALLKKSGVTS